jgi:mRNA interferase MazF
MSLKRGEIALTMFPDSNLRTARRRPTLVVQSDGLRSGLPQIVLAMITSNMARGHPSRVTVLVATPQGRQSGLKLDSVIMTDNLHTVLESEIDSLIGVWPDMAAVDAALRHTLGL